MKITGKELKQLLTEADMAPSALPITINGNSRYNSITKKYELFININGIDRTDADNLVRKYPAYKQQLKDKRNIFRKIDSIFDAQIYLDSPEFTSIYNDLAKSRKYIMPDIDTTKALIAQVKFDIVTKKDKEEGKSKYETMLENIFNTLNDPETQRLLQSMGKIGFDINEKAFGHVLAAANAIRAYSINPNSTFIATRTQWLAVNRILVPNPTPIILYKPKVVGGKDYNKAEQALGVKFADVKDSWQMKHKFEIEASSAEAGSLPYVAFDVSDTRVIPGMPDNFVMQKGLENNLIGVLNQISQQLLSTKPNPDDGAVMPTSDVNKLSIAKNILLKYLSENNYITSKSDYDRFSAMDPANENTITELLKKYYWIEFEREDNKKVREAKILAGILATLITENIAKAEGLRLYNIYESNIKQYLTDKKYFGEIFIPVSRINGVLKSFNEAKENINEMQINSPEDLMRLFHINPESLTDNSIENGLQKPEGPTFEETETEQKPITEEIDKIKEEFFSTLNKLYKVH